jgi:hypothetical protein
LTRLEGLLSFSKQLEYLAGLRSAFNTIGIPELALVCLLSCLKSQTPYFKS